MTAPEPPPSEPPSATREVEPSAATTWLGRAVSKTRVFPRKPQDKRGVAQGSERQPTLLLGRLHHGSADRTRTLAPDSARTEPRTPQSRPTGSASGEQSPRRVPRLLRPLTEWLSRLFSRVLVGPAGELDYAVPAELRRSYRVLDTIGAGGEAVVYRVQPSAAPGSPPGAPASQAALKLYRPGHDINRPLLDRLRARTASDPYIPAIQGYGHARSAWGEDLAWEVQELFAHGSLRGLMENSTTPFSEQRACDIVAAVAACLRFWQEELQHNHTDVKPENLLVREADPPVFALTDFGGAVRATMSRVYGGFAITEDYAAPEVVEGRREAPAAWWSLGIMVHELMTGRRPERGENWLTARNTDVDVSAIPQERWRLLAGGLLTPVPQSRWGYSEVTQWLSGETPRVVKARRYAPITFADLSHDDPPSLAFDLLDRSDKGEVWLRAHWRSLRTWLDREVNDYSFDREYLTRLDAHPEHAHLAISALAARFVPGMAPRYRGHEISAEGMLALANGGGVRHSVLREAIELEALGSAARHWCGHPECRAEGTNRCALLEGVQHDVPRIMDRFGSLVDSLAATESDGFVRPEDDAQNAAWALATEIVLDSEAARKHRRLLRAQTWHPLRRSAAPHTPWWHEQRHVALRGPVGEVAANAALLASVVLLPNAARAGAVARSAQRESTHARWRSWAQAASAKLGGGFAKARDRARATGTGLRSGEPEDTDGRPPPYPPPAPPLTEREQRRVERRRRADTTRVDKGMRQIHRAMRAGRCRRFAFPLALLGALDGIGRYLIITTGVTGSAAWVSQAQGLVTALTQNAAMRTAAEITSGLLSLLPGGIGLTWWFAPALGAVLLVVGRTAASQRRKARTQLIAYRLAVAGSVLMVLRLLASGLLWAAMGLLIPLSMLAG